MTLPVQEKMTDTIVVLPPAFVRTSWTVASSGTYAISSISTSHFDLTKGVR
jgi:hypothetical protein